jgi:DNA-binding transcriptional LysR family regulator
LRRFDYVTPSWIKNEIIHNVRHIETGEKREFSLVSARAVSTTFSAISLVRNHFGVALLPDYLVNGEIGSGLLINLLPD